MFGSTRAHRSLHNFGNVDVLLFVACASYVAISVAAGAVHPSSLAISTTVVAIFEALPTKVVGSSEHRLAVPPVLDCSYDEGWEKLRTSLQQNIDGKWNLDIDVFHLADTLIAAHIRPFLHFHKTKSNEFFYDCDRVEPEGKVCLYGMLTAFVVHHVYLRFQIERHPEIVSKDDISTFRDSTSMARLMLVNKNNCLDFFDSSDWPFTLERLIMILHPPEVHVLGTHFDLEPPKMESLWPPPPTIRNIRNNRIVVYITGTHAALAREPAEMLSRFVGPLLGCEVLPVLEVADAFHCQFLDCDRDGTSDIASQSSVGKETGMAPSVGVGDVGLRKLAEDHFQPRWAGLEIDDLPELRRRFTSLFSQHRLSREADVFVCTSPAVLCTLFLPFGRPLVAYLGEPILLSVPKEEVNDWWHTFQAMVTAPGAYFACYNRYLSEMIRFQTGLSLPVVRLHGLYTGARYSATSPHEVLVVKGPNICLDPGCLLNRFAASAAGGSGDRFTDNLRFVSMDEIIGGLAYERMASFRAAVIYPYDVALALFYELYTMGVPMLLPKVTLLRFYVFRGLHSDSAYHHISPGVETDRDVPKPFIAAMDYEQWFRASTYWSGLTDFATFPNLLRFGTVAELLAVFQPGVTDWAAISNSMRRFNEDQLVVSAAQWSRAVSGALPLNRFS
eukprot:TRINITY_DN21982_c0_g1_i1.p1 TRINITY_DN21982_c0_g1~~TRINITY_DN21982_c0_g1_i1.p1  ORF type:complete len:672 (-),score=80.94 TRINITY_DN21982_c0_g1_i1:28-2043(-)